MNEISEIDLRGFVFIPKLRWHNFIYGCWTDDDDTKGLWMKEGPWNYVCIYQQNMVTKYKGILQWCLLGSLYSGMINYWFENERIPWWHLSLWPETTVFPYIELLSISPEEKTNVNGSLFKLVISFIDIYIDFVHEFKAIRNIDFDTIEFGAAFDYKQVCVI